MGLKKECPVRPMERGSAVVGVAGGDLGSQRVAVCPPTASLPKSRARVASTASVALVRASSAREISSAESEGDHELGLPSRQLPPQPSLVLHSPPPKLLCMLLPRSPLLGDEEHEPREGGLSRKVDPKKGERRVAAG